MNLAEAGRSEILATARTFVDDIEPRDLEDAPRLAARLRVVAERSPGVTRAAVYRTGSGGGIRVASTDSAELSAPVKPRHVDPIASGRPIYEEEREDGRHTAELSFPIFLQGMDRPAVALGLYLDLAPRDAALAARQRKILAVALGAAIALGLLLAVMFGRSMFRPLDRLARATRAIRDGELGHAARLAAWR